MKDKQVFDLDEIRSKYPDYKPVCFNYMQAREDILRLCEMVERLRNKEITER